MGNLTRSPACTSSSSSECGTTHPHPSFLQPQKAEEGRPWESQVSGPVPADGSRGLVSSPVWPGRQGCAGSTRSPCCRCWSSTCRDQPLTHGDAALQPLPLPICWDLLSASRKGRAGPHGTPGPDTRSPFLTSPSAPPRTPGSENSTDGSSPFYQLILTGHSQSDT